MKTDLSALSVEEVLEWIEQQEKSRKLRLDNPQVVDLIKALLRHPKRRRPEVIDEVLYARQDRGNPIPKKFEHSIQSAFNQHNKDSEVWKGGGPQKGAVLLSGRQRQRLVGR
jgi:hypothetical protein